MFLDEYVEKKELEQKAGRLTQEKQGIENEIKSLREEYVVVFDKIRKIKRSRRKVCDRLEHYQQYCRLKNNDSVNFSMKVAEKRESAFKLMNTLRTADCLDDIDSELSNKLMDEFYRLVDEYEKQLIELSRPIQEETINKIERLDILFLKNEVRLLCLQHKLNYLVVSIREKSSRKDSIDLDLKNIKEKLEFMPNL